LNSIVSICTTPNRIYESVLIPLLIEEHLLVPTWNRTTTTREQELSNMELWNAALERFQLEWPCFISSLIYQLIVRILARKGNTVERHHLIQTKKKNLVFNTSLVHWVCHLLKTFQHLDSHLRESSFLSVIMKLCLYRQEDSPMEDILVTLLKMWPEDNKKVQYLKDFLSFMSSVSNEQVTRNVFVTFPKSHEDLDLTDFEWLIAHGWPSANGDEAKKIEEWQKDIWIPCPSLSWSPGEFGLLPNHNIPNLELPFQIDLFANVTNTSKEFSSPGAKTIQTQTDKLNRFKKRKNPDKTSTPKTIEEAIEKKPSDEKTGNPPKRTFAIQLMI